MVRELVAPVRRVHGDTAGSALVEAALVLPVLLILVAGIVMAGRVAHAQIAVQSVAREAGRTVAIAPSESEGLAAGEARALAVASGHGLATAQLGLVIDAGGFERGGVVRVEASYPVGLGDLPLIGALDITVTGSHEQRIDLYRSRVEVAP